MPLGTPFLPLKSTPPSTFHTLQQLQLHSLWLHGFVLREKGGGAASKREESGLPILGSIPPVVLRVRRAMTGTDLGCNDSIRRQKAG